MPLTHKIRLKCDKSVLTRNVTDFHGNELGIQQGTRVHLYLGLFDNGQLENMADIDYIRAEIKEADASSIEPALAAVDVQNIDLNAALTSALWSAGTDQHAEAVFLPADTALSAGTYRLIVRGFGNGLDEEVTYLSANIEIHNDTAGLLAKQSVPGEDGLTFKGFWNAAANLPAVSDATGNNAEFYIVTLGGTIDLGSGDITVNENDRIVHDGVQWIHIIHPPMAIQGEPGPPGADGEDGQDGEDGSDADVDTYLTPGSLVSSAAIAWDVDVVGVIAKLTQDHNTTITLSNLGDGQSVSLNGKVGVSGPYTISIAHAGLTVRAVTGALADIAALAAGDFYFIEMRRIDNELFMWISTHEV